MPLDELLAAQSFHLDKVLEERSGKSQRCALQFPANGCVFFLLTRNATIEIMPVPGSSLSALRV